jgi:AcrR family transcriptional regulator
MVIRKDVPVRKRGRPRSAMTDRAILRATLKLMREHGYAGMSIEAVAVEAGVSRPTIYLRYPGGKSELATAALADMRNRGEIEHSGETRTDLIAELRRFYQGIQRPFGMAMIGSVLAEEHHHPELLAHFREHVVAPRRRLLRSVLEEARERGELTPDADLDATINMLVGSYYASYLAGENTPDDWPERTVSALLPSILANR